ncbi:MAG TPA: hypothetical protein VM055_06580 [Novosphingobium sp.]|nr:hypothetical protein [Novosphingobium sp.]
MTAKLTSTARFAAALACATMIASPVLAAAPKPKTVPITIPLSAKPGPAAWTPADESYADHRRYRRYRHHDGVDGGDVLGGLLILGGIAAVAGAIHKDKQERRERTQGGDYPYPDRPYDYRQGERAYDERGSSRELDRAVEACSAEASRAGQVDRIFDVDKIDGEWRVRGDYRGGREFTCTVDSNGRAYIGTGDHAQNDAWDAPGDDGPRPELDDGSDDRYGASQAPDFEDTRGR